ncbi:hypothetical protein [Rhizobium sp. RCC_161_2]|uniref:hypothetical protein n=1 Tax=Rhizobium sp. RCC_161_2 TaxID=3239219 RepID=UPI0035265AFC
MADQDQRLLVRQIAYNAGLEIRYAIASSSVDPITHIPAVDAIIECRLVECRSAALEEAAKIAERLGSHLVRGETGPEYVGGNLDVAAAIRSLAKAKEADHG